MEGGNGATIGSGITQFAEGEPKRLSRASTLVSRHAAVLCRIQPHRPTNIRRRSRKPFWIADVSPQKKASRKVRKVRKVLNW